LNTIGFKNELINKIQSREAKIAVMGLGYVGLPTATVFASIGFKVTGLDINPKIITQINSGKLVTKEFGLNEQVNDAYSNGFLNATSKPFEALSDADIIIVSVQTPLDKDGNANLSFLEGACEDISLNLKKNKCVVIQSTVPPKTIIDLVVPILEGKSRLICGEDFWLTYCPERMAPGTGLHDLSANARLIGAYNSDSAIIGSELFRLVTNGELLITDIPSAEVSKLAENAFRFVNIGFANELALICKEIGVDVNEVIRLANTHPRVNIHQPGCGAGGPCLSKDTNLILSGLKASSFRAEILNASTKLNSNMPVYVVDLATEALNKVGKGVNGSKIAVFGTAYKGGVNDSRDSPAKGIIQELKQRGAYIVVFDPNCDESFGEVKATNLVEAVKGTDCIIIATDHKEFREINLELLKPLMKQDPIIVDGKRIINADSARHLGFDYVAMSFVKVNKFVDSRVLNK
jgi:UDP-N-acetyl-D-mannosaminuronic acid dehydrogenase